MYCRKSSEPDERQALSNESQEQENLKTAERNGIVPEQIITPVLVESHSAKIEYSRPVFNSMIEAIKNGKANGIICWYPDRLSRNNGDMTVLINLLESGKLEEIVTSSQVFKNNPMDKFMFGFLCIQAKLENDKKGIDVKRGLKTKAEMGWLPSGAKPGYMNQKDGDKGNKIILTDPIRFPLIKRCWELALRGASPVSILEKLNNEWGFRTPIQKTQGGKPMSRSKIYAILHDPFYYGWFQYGGTWYQGKHEPMITKKEFDQVQEILGSRKGLIKPIKEFTYSGLIRCGECGAAVTAEEKISIKCSKCKRKFSVINRDNCPDCGTKIKDMTEEAYYYEYYHCTKRRLGIECHQRSISLANIEYQLIKFFDGISISDKFIDWAKKHLKELPSARGKDDKLTSLNIDKAVKIIDTKIDQLNDIMISPQNKQNKLFTSDEFANKKQKLLEEKQELLKQKNSRIETNWEDQLNKNFDFAAKVREKYKNGSKKEKREIVVRLSSKLILKDETLEFTMEKPFNYIESMVMVEPTITRRFENKKIKVNYVKLKSKWSGNPALLPRVDSNHGPIA